MKKRLDLSEQRGVLACVLLSSTLAVVLFSRVVFAGEWLAGRDMLRVHLPFAKYWAERIRSGEFPEWYPYDALGQPFVGMVISGAFHPWRLLLLLGSPEHVVSWAAVASYPIAAAGTYACARLLSLSRGASVFAAVSFAFCGYLVSISNNLLYLVAAATIPWVLACAEHHYRRPSILRALLAGAVLASTVLVGDPQTFTICGAGVVVLAFARPSPEPFKQRALHAAAVIGCAILLALPQILPAMYVFVEARSDLNPVQSAQVFSFHPLRLVELVLGPLFINEEAGVTASLRIAELFDPKMKTVWVDSAALGPLSVFLGVTGALLGWRMRLTRVLSALALILGLMMLGRHLPVYGWVYQAVPLWRAFRYPEKLLPYLSLIVALAAAYAADRTAQDERARKAVLLSGLAFAALLLLAAGAQYFGDAWSGAMHALGVGPRHGGLLGRRFLLFSLGGSLTCALAVTGFRFARPSVALGLLCALQGALLTWQHLPIPFTVNLDLLNSPGGFIAGLLETGRVGPGKSRVHAAVTDYRIPTLAGYDVREVTALGMAATLEPDVPALFGIEFGGYYLPAGSSRFVRGYLADRLFLDRLVPLYSVEFLTAGLKTVRNMRADRPEQPFATLPEWDLVLLRHPAALPRAYLARPRCIADQAAAIRALQAGDFAPGDEALVECGTTGVATVGAAEHRGVAQIVSFAPERVEVAVDAAAEGLVLVLNDAFFGGWTAEVDGVDAVILPANLAVRAVPVPAGAHTVVFRYRERGLRPALWACVAGVLVLAAMELWRRRKGDQSGHPG